MALVIELNNEEGFISNSSNSSFKIGDQINLTEDVDEFESNNSIESKFLGNSFSDHQPVNVGKIKILLYKNENPIISIGPDYHLPIILIIITFAINFFSVYYMYIHILIVYLIINEFLFLTYIVTYILTIFSNPGIPTRDSYLNYEIGMRITNSSINEYLVCNSCNVYVKDNTSIGHCMTCDICIIGYDHHCGWSSKCIGKGNYVVFKIFSYSLLIYFLYNIGILIYFLII